LRTNTTNEKKNVLQAMKEGNEEAHFFFFCASGGEKVEFFGLFFVRRITNKFSLTVE
jgi:hypothetical protein